MDAREKEQYLREYQTLKEKGKPFFPYAILKDSVMSVVVLLVIILMAVLLGAELGPKADPTTTTYTPRPEWYFFFLFELLRVIKPPEFTVMATVGIPGICLALLLLLPFFDRSPERDPLRRPIATIAGITAMGAMAYLTILGATAGSASELHLEVPPQHEEGASVVASSGCLGCHHLGENGNPQPGPPLDEVGQRLPRQAIARALLNPTAPMPSYKTLREREPEKFDELVNFLSSLR